MNDSKKASISGYGHTADKGSIRRNGMKVSVIYRCELCGARFGVDIDVPASSDELERIVRDAVFGYAKNTEMHSCAADRMGVGHAVGASVYPDAGGKR